MVNQKSIIPNSYGNLNEKKHLCLKATLLVQRLLISIF